MEMLGEKAYLEELGKAWEGFRSGEGRVSFF